MLEHETQVLHQLRGCPRRFLQYGLLQRGFLRHESRSLALLYACIFSLFFLYISYIAFALVFPPQVLTEYQSKQTIVEQWLEPYYRDPGWLRKPVYCVDLESDIHLHYGLFALILLTLLLWHCFSFLYSISPDCESLVQLNGPLEEMQGILKVFSIRLKWKLTTQDPVLIQL